MRKLGSEWKLKGKRLCASVSSVRDKKVIFTAEIAKTAEKKQNKKPLCVLGGRKTG